MRRKIYRIRFALQPKTISVPHITVPVKSILFPLVQRQSGTRVNFQLHSYEYRTQSSVLEKYSPNTFVTLH